MISVLLWSFKLEYAKLKKIPKNIQQTLCWCLLYSDIIFSRSTIKGCFSDPNFHQLWQCRAKFIQAFSQQWNWFRYGVSSLNMLLIRKILKIYKKINNKISQAGCFSDLNSDENSSVIKFELNKNILPKHFLLTNMHLYINSSRGFKKILAFEQAGCFCSKQAIQKQWSLIWLMQIWIISFISL